MSFYLDEGPPFLLPEAEDFFASEGITLVPFEEANAVVPTELFNSVKLGRNFLAIPVPQRVNVPIPYEPGAHCEYKIDGVRLSSIIEEYINSRLSDEKYIFSLSTDAYFAIKFKKFSYEILYNIYHGHLNTPMMLCDNCHEFSIIFEFDLEINTISRPLTHTSDLIGGRPDEYWISYFNDNFLESISYSEMHINIINDLYGSVIKGVNIPRRRPASSHPS